LNRDHLRYVTRSWCVDIAGGGLSFRIIQRATDLFARETGFSGPEIHELFADYTDALGPYRGWGGGAASRWQIFQDGLNALSHADQRVFLLSLCEYDGSCRYGLLPAESREALRTMLLEDTTPGATAAGAGLAKLTDWAAVTKAWQAALGKVSTDPEGAITATRTMLESICKHICDERAAAYDDGWDLARLYKAAAGSMEIAPDQHSEQIIKQILTGVTTVVAGLAAMRNTLSDAHGKSKRSVRPAPRHAKLAVSSGFAIAGFLIDTHIEKKSPPKP
jgi:hypothetical protein